MAVSEMETTKSSTGKGRLTNFRTLNFVHPPCYAYKPADGRWFKSGLLARVVAQLVEHLL